MAFKTNCENFQKKKHTNFSLYVLHFINEIVPSSPFNLKLLNRFDDLGKELGTILCNFLIVQRTVDVMNERNFNRDDKR